jgi:outer membrane protein OmpA-like peptidoglycan-associated protein
MKSLQDIPVSHGPAPAARVAQEQQARSASLGRANFDSPGALPQSTLEGGVELPQTVNTVLEARLDSDFSKVRVHTDTSAAASADAIGARAFTFGSDIVFGSGQYSPASKEGQALIAHELAHTVQQAQMGDSVVQMDPQKKKGGIGSEPPKEDFTTLSGVAPEDGFVLFAFDNAVLTGAGEKKIAAMLVNEKSPVTVSIHGYASSEGDAEYNTNLAAQRAAAIKRFIEKKLPAGSKVLLFSHGETSAFGKLEDNRRVGIKIQQGVVETVTDVKQPGVTFGLGMRKPVLDLGLGKPLYLTDPSLLKPPGTYGSAPGGLGQPPSLAPLPKFSDIDWESIRSKYVAHGMRLDDRDITGVEQQWNYSYRFFRQVLPDDLAIKGANLAVPFAVDNVLARENPNIFDKSDQQFKAAYPNEKHLVIPVVSSDILGFIYSKLKGSDKQEDKDKFRL